MGKFYDYKVREGAESAPAKLLALVGRGSKVLEIGCSTGSQTRVLSNELGCKVVAIEIDPEAAEHARPYCEHLIVGSIESVNAAELAVGEPYDVVICADVLEHLLDPRLALEKVRPLISSNGCLLASIPNVTHCALVFEMMNGRFEYRDYGLLDATHVRFFDRHGVLRLFEDSGYFVEKVDRVVTSPAKTEFHVVPADSADHFVLDYMSRRNPDSDTFQFIVRAVPTTTPNQSKSALESARRRLAAAERELVALRETLSRRESELQWISRRPWNRVAGLIRGLLPKGDG
jgi:2-polyprenyl-3-methyl-5-hydroxy-6-metoxy-1,4-benzoquinol methylase